MLLLTDDAQVQSSDTEDHLADLFLPFTVLIQLSLQFRLQLQDLFMILINPSLELLALMSILVRVLLSFSSQLLNSLGPAFFLSADPSVHLAQLCLLLLHVIEPLQDTHDTKLISVSWSEVIRQVSDLLQELLIDLIFLDVGSDFVKLCLFYSEFFIFFFDLLSSLLISNLQFLLLAIVLILLAIVQKDLLLLTLKLGRCSFLFQLKLLLLDS